MDRAKRAWVVCVAVVAGACGGGEPASPEPARTAGGEAKPAPAAEPAKPKVDVQAMFARESEPGALQDFSTPDGSLKGKIEAAAPPAVAIEEGFVHIATRVAENQVDCLVYPEAKDGAEVARLVIGETLDKAVPAEQRAWVDVHGDHAAGWPYVIARAHYLAETEGGKAAGDFKLAVSVRGETTVVCSMDAPGYYASFERVLKSLLGSLDSASNRALAKPQYAEIVRTALAGRLVSLTRRTVTLENKRMVERSWGMEMMVGPTGALRTSDDASTEGWEKGRLVNGTYAKYSMGQADHVMELTTGKGDRYQVKGTVQDKPVSAEFDVKGGLPDEARSKALICRVRDGKQPSAELQGYEPGIDPLQVSVIKVDKSTAPDAQIRVTIGSTTAVEMNVRVDEDCDIERGVVVTGPLTIPIERLWHEEQ